MNGLDNEEIVKAVIHEPYFTYAAKVLLYDHMNSH